MERIVNDFPICPYCGYVDRNAWEVDFGTDDLAEIDCGSCEKTYTCVRHLSVSYTTKAIDRKSVV